MREKSLIGAPDTLLLRMRRRAGTSLASNATQNCEVGNGVSTDSDLGLVFSPFPRLICMLKVALTGVFGGVNIV